MTPAYRSIPADNGEDIIARRSDVQSFEVDDDAHYRPNNYDRSARRNIAVIITTSGILALFLVMAGHKAGAVKKGLSKDKKNDPNAENPKQSRKDDEPKTVFCYGDSLTYGMVGAGVQETFPYATFLEQELSISTPEMTQPKTIVEHLGHPGWTALNMLNHIDDATDGMCTIIRSRPSLSLLIILAGTNDIGVMTDAGREAAGTIIESIVNLHKGAISCAKGVNNIGLHTLAIGIPGSAYQERERDAAEMASHVNNAMENFASSDSRISYAAFPFPYQDNDSKWSRDGLHLSQDGYAFLAQALAPQVRTILESIQQA